MLKSNAGETLRHARFAKGWTLDKLSDESKVAVATIVALEKGHRKEPQGQKVWAVATALDLDPSELFETEAAS